MIAAFFLIGIGVFGLGAITVAVGMFIDNDTVINIGIIMLLVFLGAIVLSLIAGGVYMLRR